MHAHTRPISVFVRNGTRNARTHGSVKSVTTLTFSCCVPNCGKLSILLSGNTKLGRLKGRTESSVNTRCKVFRRDSALSWIAVSTTLSQPGSVLNLT